MTALIKHGFGAHKEKGSVRGAALWVDHSAKFVAQSVSCFDFFRRRRLISPNMAELMNCPVLSPVSFTCSMPSMISCAIRAVTDCDLEFLGPVAIHETYNDWCKTIYTKLSSLKSLTCKTPITYRVSYTKFVGCYKTTKLSSVTSTDRASNHNVIGANTMAYQHSTQTRPKFQYRFLALNRSDMSAKPCRVSVEAPTEHDARMVLAPYFILSLAARLPAQGVCHA